MGPALSAFGGNGWEQFRFYVLLGFLALCLLGGGAGRADVTSLLYLRPAAVLCLLLLLISPGRWEFRRYRAPFLFLGAFAALIVAQLIPLPPGLWTRLPGHAPFAEAAAAAGFAEPWRPLSLSPDLTLNSLVALLPCFVVLVGLAAIRPEQRQSLLPLLIGFAVIDVLLSLIQITSDPNGAAYLYRVTNNGVPVGFFSNRNHHATFLALVFPMLAIWIGMPARNAEYWRTRFWIALLFGLFLIPIILAMGSRAGAVAGGLGLVIAYCCAPPLAAGWPRRWRVAFGVGVLLIPILLVALTFYADRALSIMRLTDVAMLENEGRLQALPILFDLLKSFSPLGVGYGAFDPAFRILEPDWALSPQYFNHAHNDLLELAITGGVPALILLLLFLLWFGKRAFDAFAASGRETEAGRLARLGAAMILIVLGTSLVDYPLRTPLLAAVFTVACGWLAAGWAPEAAKTGGDGAHSLDAPNRILRAMLVVVFSTGLGWVTWGVTISSTVGRLHPALALQWWPWDARTRAAAAARALEGRRPSPASLAEAKANAEAALARDPLNVTAARSLGLLAAMRGNSGQANRLIRYSQSLSRRDLPTQLWLIETRVRQNDVEGALFHYDRALRTSNGAKDLLFPILLRASETDDIRPALAATLGQRPLWWREFVNRLIAEGRSAVAIETIFNALRLDPNNAEQQGLTVGAINRLIQIGGYRNAFRLYRRAGGARNVFVHNGGFEAENRFAPIDWVMGDSVEFAGVIQPRSDGRGHALSPSVSEASGTGTIARQLLILPAGAYRFTVSAGNITEATGARPRISLSCLASGDIPLNLRLPAVPSSGRQLAQDFTIGGGCPAQWLIIEASGTADTSAELPWIDDIAITHRR